MRVLHLISSGGMYGAEAVILNLSHVLNTGVGNESVLGVFSNTARPNLQLHQTALKAGFESHLIACSGQVDLGVPAAVRQLVRQTKADVVHAHGYKADVYAYIALRDTAVPLVSTCHTWYDSDWFVRLYGSVDRWILRRFDGVVAVSEQVQERLIQSGVRQERVRLIRNGIDLKLFAGVERERDQSRPDTGALRIGLVGRLAPEKGVDVFLRAAAEIVGRWPETQFFVAGDGPDLAALQDLLEELGLRGHAFLLGRREDMPSLYGSIDVLVSASLQEGLPMVLLEGMASKLPVVATSVGAVPQIVQNGETGLLVVPGNSSKLAAAMERMLLESGLRQTMATAGKQLIEREFSAERMTAEYMELYRHVLKEGTAQAA